MHTICCSMVSLIQKLYWNFKALKHLNRFPHRDYASKELVYKWISTVYTFSSHATHSHELCYPTPPPTTASPASITLYLITALIFGVISFGSGILFAGVCNCIPRCHEQWRIDRKSSKCTTGVATEQRGGSPEYEEIPTPESGSRNDVQLQHNTAYFVVQSSH